MYLSGMSSISISEELNCSKPIVLERLKKMNIDIRKTKEYPEITKDLLYKLYINEKKSTRDIAKIFNCGTTLIFKRMKQFNIKGRMPNDFTEDERAFKFGSQKEKHPLWSGGVTPLRNHLRQTIVPWIKESAKQCDYKCIITSGRYDVVHHLHGYNKIVYETLNMLEYPIYEEVRTYSTTEMKNIEKLVLELHYQYGYGVCLSNEIHELFHMLYGKGGNTPEQFTEFKEYLFTRKYQ